MILGVVGLGRMGSAIANRAVKAGHSVVAFDADANTRDFTSIETVNSLKELASKVEIIWLMVPAGDVVDEVINSLELKKGSIVIDGGNSNFEDTKRRYQLLKAKGVSYLDCGTSGGVAGEREGFSLMVGGDRSSYEAIVPILEVIATKDGYAYMGSSGAGHYVKMVHNGVEYALLQSYAEGFHLLKESEFDLDLEKVANVWNHGGVVRSWILTLVKDIFHEGQELSDISGVIEENKTGRWTSDEAKKKNVPVDLINRSLEIRAESRESGGNYGTKIVAMLRNKFGGHRVLKNE